MGLCMIDIAPGKRSPAIPLIGENDVPIRVVRYESSAHEAQWDAFIGRSMNGTAFHSQQFLRYHPEGRFNFQHLLFFEGHRLVAVLPGGLREHGRVFESPLGASYGSFVTEDISAQTALDIVAAFERYIRAQGIEEVYLTSAPVIYQPLLTQNLEFALLYRGYAYQRHYISHAIDLRHAGVPFDRFQSVARKHIRRVTRENPSVWIEESQPESLREMLVEFYPILLENKAKYHATPTHTLEDLFRLHELLPDFMKLFLVRVGEEPVAGSLLFLANDRVALIFYHMLRYQFDHLKPIYLLMDQVTRWAKQEGYHFVDIGVSQDTSDENPMTPALSLIHFKEKFDSRGVLRSTLHKSYDA
jgi:hypothetical protein